MPTLTDPLSSASSGAQTQASPAPSVAVVIAAWRAAGTIGKAVASALAQPEAAEIVVVDDASGDQGATLAAARAADDGSGRLKVIALDANGGPARARNVAISASTSPWICVLDSDDFMEPGRLSRLLAHARDGHDFIADDLMQTPEGSPASAGRTMWFDGPAAPQDISFSDFVRGNIPHRDRARRELGFLKPLMRRDWLAANAIAYDEAMRLGEDYDLYARALAAGARFRLVPWTGYVSVMRTDSLSAHHSRKDLAALEAADVRLLARGLTPEQARDVSAHLFSTRKRLVWIDTMAAIKGLNPIKAAWVMLRDPRHAPHVIAGLWEIVVRRLTGARR